MCACKSPFYVGREIQSAQIAPTKLLLTELSWLLAEESCDAGWTKHEYWLDEAKYQLNTCNELAMSSQDKTKKDWTLASCIESPLQKMKQ